MQKEREDKLAEILKNRLNQYVQGDKDGFISNAEVEVSKLSNAGKVSIYCVMYPVFNFLGWSHWINNFK